MARQTTRAEGRTKTSLTIRIEIDGARETLRAFRKLPKDASNALRDASLKLSRDLAARAQSAARADSDQSALIAPTIKPRRDRVPMIVAGGAKRVGRNRRPAFKILFGSEFGASSETRNRGGPMRQYRDHLGRQGYWFFPLVEQEEARISREWNAAADEVVNRFTADSGGVS